MKHIIDLILKLADQDIRLYMEDGKLKINAPSSGISDASLGEIKQYRAELLAYFSSNRSVSKIGIEPAKVKESYVLSSSQRRLWILSQFEQGNAAYNMAGINTIQGRLNKQAFEKAFRSLINRHEILRTSFKEDESGEIKQFILPAEEVLFGITYHHLVSQKDKEEALKLKLEEELATPFQLSKGPLVRVTLYETGDNEWVFVYVMHHIISDGWSMDLLIQQFLLFYQVHINTIAEIPFPEFRIQYKDYAEWQQRNIKSGIYDKNRQYWLEHFSGELPTLQLPTDRIRPINKTYNGGTIYRKIAAHTTEHIKDFSKSRGGTLFMGLLAAINTLFYRYTNQNDIIIGSPVSGREIPELEEQIGFYVNTLALRIQLNKEDSFTDIFDRVKSVTIDAYENQSYPFDELVEALSLDRNSSRNALFDVMVVLQNTRKHDQSYIYQMEDIQISSYNSASNLFSKFDLCFTFQEYEEQLQLVLDYNTDIYDENTVGLMAGHFEQILHSSLLQPNLAIKDLDYLTDEEQRKLLVDFNDTTSEYQRELTLVDLFERQVEVTPEAAALVFEKKEMSYRTLNANANRLAHFLKSNFGIQSNDSVGILTDRSEKTIVAMIGILKAGGCYIPMDTLYTEDRISYIIEKSNVKVVIVNNNSSWLNESIQTVNFVSIDEILSDEHYSLQNPNIPISASDLAYVIYTSGSTGNPKGVPIRHYSVHNLVNSLNKVVYTKYNNKLRVALMASYVFDASVQQIFASLLGGHALYVIPEHVKKSGDQILSFLKLHEIEVTDCTPAHIQLFQFAARSSFEGLHLRNMIVGGDVLQKRSLVDIFQLYTSTDFLITNVYGPTECTVDSTYHVISRNDLLTLATVPIGRPVSNTKIFILDNNNKMQPIGVWGQICISGDGLSKGYINQELLTNEKFVPNPYETESILYLTGDVGRWLHNGTLEYLERKDNQVKIRGYRVETGEVESLLLAFHQINEVAVVAKKDKHGINYLVAYLVAKIALDIVELKNFLSNNLLDYMIPSYFVQLKKLPLTLNGKVDKKKLQRDDHKVVLGLEEYVAPRTEIEKHLVEIWKEVLDREFIGITDNFFSIGGHSLKAVQVVSRIRKEWQSDIDVSVVFNNPTIISLAKVILNAQFKTYAGIPKLVYQKDYELSPAQHRMWILSQFPESSLAYNISFGLLFEGILDYDVLESSFHHVIARHEILRTVFELSGNGEPRQLIRSELLDFRIDYRDWSNTPSQYNSLEELYYEEQKVTFDLSMCPLFRIKLVKLADEKHAFLLTMHHIISDGWSMELLSKEVVSVYNAITNGEDIALPALEIQYKDYAAWQNNSLSDDRFFASEKYWLATFQGQLPVLDLLSNKQRPSIKTYNGSSIRKCFNDSLTGRLKSFCNQEGGTLFVGLLASLNALLFRYTGQDDIIVGTPIAGRGQKELENQIGLYLNTLALRNRFSGKDGFAKLFKTTQEILLGAYTHQAYPFDKLIDKLNVKRDISRSPLFDVMIILHNQSDIHNTDLSSKMLDGLTVSTLKNVKDKTSQFDLLFNFSEAKDGLILELQYNTDVYAPDWVERFCCHYEQLLNRMLDSSEEAIDQLDYLSSTERQELLNEFNHTVAVYPDKKTIVDLFEEQVNLSPQATAVVFEHKSLTYAELNEESNRLAHFLRSHYEIRTGAIVGIVIERSEKMIISLLAILKCGGAYVPIDPVYPRERIGYVLENSGASLVITDFHQKIDQVVIKQFAWAEDAPLLTSMHSENIGSKLEVDDLAYVIYTSGSTGLPKGVMVDHRGVVNRIDWMWKKYNFTTEDIILQKTPYVFDVSVWELFMSLCFGAKLVLCKKEVIYDPYLLIDHIHRHQITTLHFVPSMLNVFVEALSQDTAERIRSVRHIFASGEALLKESVHKYYQMNAAVLHNLYGPTEASVDVSYFETTPDSSVIPIGKPISNIQLMVLDHNHQLVPKGVAGEICISGVGLAKGYINNVELTSDRFVAHPFEEGARMYKTGDIGRWLTDGNIEYLGRRDNQVKIRGYRIELGEIENTLLQYDGIIETVVLAQKSKDGDPYLTAYLVSEKTLNVVDLRTHLNVSLPSYMIPSFFIQLKELPLTTNGKTDRNLLLSITKESSLSNEITVAPRNDLENRLLEIWAELLGHDNIGVKDNFFEVGGNSLKIMQLSRIISAEFLTTITAVELFKYTTIESIALQLSSKEESSITSIEV